MNIKQFVLYVKFNRRHGNQGHFEKPLLLDATLKTIL